MAEATALPELRGSLRVEDRRDLRVAGPLTAAEGTRVTLQALGDDVARGTVSWAVGNRSIGQGSAVTVSAPRRSGATLLVTARVTLPSGVVSHAQHLLIATAQDKGRIARIALRDAD